MTANVSPQIREQVYGLFSDFAKEKWGMSVDDIGTMVKERKLEGERVVRDNVDSIIGNMKMSPGGIYEKMASDVIRRDSKWKGLGLKVGMTVRAYAAAARNHINVQDVLRGWGHKWLADEITEAHTKSLVANTLTSGGAIVPNEYVAEVIELLRAKAVVRRSGVQEMPMKTGTMTLPRQSAAATAAYVGEAVNITSSQPSFDQLQLAAKKLGAIVPISNDLLREADPSADAVVRNDLVKVMALREDLAFIRGDGTVNTPKGTLNRTATANQFQRTQASSPTSTLAEITGDLFTVWEKVVAANIQLDTPFWWMHARTIFGLRKLRDSLGNLVFEPEMRTGNLLGVPYYMSNQIPTNITLNSVTNTSEVYFGEATEMIIGDTMQMGLEVFPGGAYYDGTAVQSGVSQDLTVIRAIALHDFIMRHSQSAGVINTVDWQ